MVRYKLTISYRGTAFHGWQIQALAASHVGTPLRTVQDVMSKAVGRIVGHPVNLIGASRTDAGVHAKGQVCQFDTTATHIPIEGLRMAVNAKLPDDVVIHTIEPIRPDFDCIFDAVHKRYQYAIWTAADRNVFAQDLHFHRWQPLDFDAMREAATHFVGEKDFASFCKAGHGRPHTVRTVMECSLSRRGALWVIGVAGKGFLWNQVRIIAGTLVEVGLGRFRPDDMPRMLAARDRKVSGSTAPASGLYLQWIRHSDVSLRRRYVPSESDPAAYPQPDGPDEE